MQSELTLRDIATPASPPDFASGDDLWPRIAATHLARRRKRRFRRIAGAGLAAAFVIVTVVGFHRAAVEPSSVDWEARAEALEIQLNQAAALSQDMRVAADTEGELARVDRALQAAYDRGAGKSELVPLWKQRSELLSVLLTVHQQQLAITRI
jgi:hypothetical protein